MFISFLSSLGEITKLHLKNTKVLFKVYEGLRTKLKNSRQNKSAGLSSLLGIVLPKSGGGPIQTLSTTIGIAVKLKSNINMVLFKILSGLYSKVKNDRKIPKATLSTKLGLLIIRKGFPNFGNLSSKLGLLSNKISQRGKMFILAVRIGLQSILTRLASIHILQSVKIGVYSFIAQIKHNGAFLYYRTLQTIFMGIKSTNQKQISPKREIKNLLGISSLLRPSYYRKMYMPIVRIGFMPIVYFIYLFAPRKFFIKLTTFIGSIARRLAKGLVDRKAKILRFLKKI